MSETNLRRARRVYFDAAQRMVVITLNDASVHAIPVDRLEMVESTPDAWVPIQNLSDEQLADVEVFGAGAYILWDELGQSFSVDNLLNGIYGRPAWMESLVALA